MSTTDIVALLVVLACVGAAVAFIVREKRRGVKCVGCTVDKSCAQKQKAAMAAGESGCCSCEAADKMLADLEKNLR